jgi:SAM-dependent methyltransferase
MGEPRGPDRQYWQERFDRGEMGWDRGGPSPQLLRWMSEGSLQPCRILVPGCGQGWEVVELAARGHDVVAVDVTSAACERLRRRLADRGLHAEVVEADVLDFTPDRSVDAIYEQTCLCALHPRHWRRYADRVRGWLHQGGMMHAVFMQAARPETTSQGEVVGPPYHCDMHAMMALFPPDRWAWPAPPYAPVPHPRGWHELAVSLRRLD